MSDISLISSTTWLSLTVINVPLQTHFWSGRAAILGQSVRPVSRFSSSGLTWSSSPPHRSLMFTSKTSFNELSFSRRHLTGPLVSAFILEWFKLSLKPNISATNFIISIKTDKYRLFIVWMTSRNCSHFYSMYVNTTPSTLCCCSTIASKVECVCVCSVYVYIFICLSSWDSEWITSSDSCEPS